MYPTYIYIYIPLVPPFIFVKSAFFMVQRRPSASRLGLSCCDSWVIQGSAARFITINNSFDINIDDITMDNDNRCYQTNI